MPSIETTNRVFLWEPVFLYMAAIFIVSAQPDPPMPQAVSDKSLHVVAYGGLAVLVCRALSRGFPARVTRRTALATLLIVIGYGVTDELHQWTVPGRSADVYDLIADALGAALGLIACWACGILGTPKSQHPQPESHR